MDRRTRVRALAAVLLLAVAALAAQGATADPAPPTPASGEGAYPGNTLITVQSYGWFDKDNGKAFVVSPDGEVVWEFDPPNSRVFDAEQLDNGNVLVAVGTWIPADDCPPEYQNTDQYGDHCVKNRVIELDYDTKSVVWNYSWYDAFIHWHEVHDADRLPSGETAIVDMGNDRAFTVNSAGEITWEWRAEEHLGPGTDFWETYVPADARDRYRPNSPEGDWTHMNDIDQLSDGTFQLSIRNFDVVVTVDPRTDEIVDVVGTPGNHSVMREQHDPNRLERSGTLLVADSENNRIVEIDPDTGTPVWVYAPAADPLQWPRDADRLPNGNTLVVDSRHFRVVEIDPAGDVVWSYSLAGERGIVYDADRLGVPEEPAGGPGGDKLAGTGTAGALRSVVAYVESWAAFVFPTWVELPELFTMFVGIVAGLGLVVEGALAYRSRRIDDSTPPDSPRS